MENRERDLFKNDVFRAAIFMDPRYNVLLSEDDKTAAREQLIALWKRLHDLAGENEENVAARSVDVCENDCDDIEQLLLKSESGINCSPAQTVININNILNSYLSWKRVSKDTDLLLYWESKKNAEPELYKLACVVQSVPATQVSVERLFSGVRHVVSDLRYNLQMHVIDDIMVVRCNSLFNS